MSDDERRRDEQFKNGVFFASEAQHNRGLYVKLYEEKGVTPVTPEEEAALQWVTPSSPAQMSEMFRLMRDAGWGANAQADPPSIQHDLVASPATKPWNR